MPTSSARSLRYGEVAVALRKEIARGNLAPGDVLPSEATLARQHGVSRVTVRKALAELRRDGLVESRQGFGSFVATPPIRQPLARLAAIEDQLRESGIETERVIKSFGFVAASPVVRRRLDTATVLRVRRVNMASGQPFACVTVWVPEDLAGDLSRSAVARSSLYDLLPVKLSGATQTISAGVASGADARDLGLEPGMPVLVCERVTRDEAGRTVLMSEFVFHPLRAEFVVELPALPATIAPSGLRLVEA
jgi:GntR family transcriptional regulator